MSAFTELPDDALIRHCQERLPDDARAFEALVIRYREQVYAIAYRMMGNAPEAEDLTQEVFIKVYRSIKRFRGEAAFSTWLYRITVNTCLDSLDKRQRRPQPVDSDFTEAEEIHLTHLGQPWETSPEQAVLRRELLECIRETMMALQARERLLLTLRDVQGLEYQKIADILNISMSALKMRIHRARLAFRQIFARLCEEFLSSA